MAYLKDIIDSGDGVIDYTVTLIGDSKVICEGFKDIISFSETEIKLKNKSTIVIVCGETLELEKLYNGFISIIGKINSVTREGL